MVSLLCFTSGRCRRVAGPAAAPPVAGHGESVKLHRSRRLSSIVEAVGKTPLVRLDRIAGSVPDVEVYVKLEFANPGGSVKDRPALRIMLDAIGDGRLTERKVLIDATSGNTGVAYAMLGAAMGYRVELV